MALKLEFRKANAPRPWFLEPLGMLDLEDPDGELSDEDLRAHLRDREGIETEVEITRPE